MNLVNELGLNQDHSCFTCGMEDGLRIYNAEPLKEKLRLDFDQVGSVSKVCMLYRTNIIAILSGPPKPKFGSHQVMIWDDHEQDFIMQYTFPQDVINVKLCRDKLIAVLKNRVYVFSFPDNSKKLMELDTRHNVHSVCELACNMGKQMLATLGVARGSIQVLDLSRASKSGSTAPVTISAHQNEIAAVAFNFQVNMMASASSKGTLIRLFDLSTRKLLTEVRRGTDQALINCIRFNRDSSYMCVTSDKETVHVFALCQQINHRRSAYTKAGKVGSLQKFTDSQTRSVCKFAIPANSQAQCFFGQNQTVNVICKDGTFHQYTCRFADNSKQATRSAYYMFLNVGDEDDF